MVRFARVEAIPDSDSGRGVDGMSVLWLIDDQGSLASFLPGFVRGVGRGKCWAVLCETESLVGPERTFKAAVRTLSQHLGLDVEATVRSEFRGGHLKLGHVVFDTAVFLCEVAAVPAGSVDFWGLYLRNQPGPYVGLFETSSATLGPWTNAAMHLAIAESAFPFRLLSVPSSVLRDLRRDFILETVKAGGIAVHPIEPEMVGYGVALTGTKGTIDRLESLVHEAHRVDPEEVALAREVALDWPWA